MLFSEGEKVSGEWIHSGLQITLLSRGWSVPVFWKELSSYRAPGGRLWLTEDANTAINAIRSV